jgi:Trk K+ transport system NAD-binding subunit
VDFDPEALAHWRGLGMDAHFGDATDPEFTAHLPLSGVKAVIAAVSRERPSLTENAPQVALVSGLLAANFEGRIVASVTTEDEGKVLRRQGATDILNPFEDAADYAINLLEQDRAAA